MIHVTSPDACLTILTLYQLGYTYIMFILDPASDCACRVQDIGLYGVLKKHVITLLMMSVFFNSPYESRACAMHVQSLAGSRFIIIEKRKG